MNEYALNQLNTVQLAEYAFSSATFLASVNKPALKIELYHTTGHFIEISYLLKSIPGHAPQWQLYTSNHYPDTPASTKYLNLYLKHIKLSVD